MKQVCWTHSVLRLLCLGGCCVSLPHHLVFALLVFVFKAMLLFCHVSVMFLCCWVFILCGVVMLSLNLSAAVWYPFVRWARPYLALPHMRVCSVADLDFEQLYELGFRGVCFDKDNTLSLPYSFEIDDKVEKQFDEACSVFGLDFVKVLSNTAGTSDDKDGLWEKKIVEEWGVEVIHHLVKKPGCVKAVRRAFFSVGCETVLCIGDRLFSDMVIGNRLGMGCVLVDPLSWGSEVGVAVRAQSHEHKLLEKWDLKGFSAHQHPLLDMS